MSFSADTHSIVVNGTNHQAESSIHRTKELLRTLSIPCHDRVKVATGVIRQRALKAQAEIIQERHAQALWTLLNDDYHALDEALDNITEHSLEDFILIKAKNDPAANELGERPVELKFVDREMLPEVAFLLSLPQELQDKLGIDPRIEIN